jgi:hypothetical protein
MRGSNYIQFEKSSIGYYQVGLDASNNFRIYNSNYGRTELSFAQVTGDASFAGTVTATGFFESSDERLKNIAVAYQSDNFGALEFTWKDGRDSKNHWGYSAQAVQKWLPDAVQENNDGYLTVDYNQAHTFKIQKLEEEIKLLKAELEEEKQGMLKVQEFIKEYREEIRDLTRQRDDLQKEHSEYSECRTAQEKLNGELSNIQERMKNECQASKDEMKRQFEGEKAVLNKTIEELKALKTSLSGPPVGTPGPPVGASGPPVARNTQQDLLAAIQEGKKLKRVDNSSSQPSSTSLLSAIQAGTKLKKVEQQVVKTEKQTELAKKIGQIRKAVANDDDKDDDNDEWKLRTCRSRAKKSKKSKKTKKSRKNKKSSRKH